ENDRAVLHAAPVAAGRRHVCSPVAASVSQNSGALQGIVPEQVAPSPAVGNVQVPAAPETDVSQYESPAQLTPDTQLPPTGTVGEPATHVPAQHCRVRAQFASVTTQAPPLT